MPSRNTLKIDAARSYYHVYARGASKQAIFLDKADYMFFENLWSRYLAAKPVYNYEGTTYPHLYGSIELLAYCLMANHFHMLVYQAEEGAMAALMRGVMTSYSRYFNKKYRRTGSLFESRYKASRISQEAYLQHISRYIHLNPRYWKRYEHSSLAWYLETSTPDWIKPAKILAMFDSQRDYLRFLEDYEGQKHKLDEIKHELADQ